MITQSDLVQIDLTQDEYSLCLGNARKACLGGRSHVRSGLERQENLTSDQLYGQIGHLCASKVLFQDIQPYVRAREIANANPWASDRGEDFPDQALQIDVKTSYMRGTANPLDYRCVVRPAERHPSTTYVQTLVWHDQGYHCWILGYMIDPEDFPAEPEQGGTFRGAYVVPAINLRPIRELVEAMKKPSYEGSSNLDDELDSID